MSGTLDSKTSPPSPRAHLNYLDGLRALAALYVVLHHAARYVVENPLSYPPQGWSKAFFSFFAFGGYSVVIFIVLSGFVLMLPVARGDGTLRGGALHFFGKRAKRILPPYYCTLIASLLLTWLCIGIPMGTPWDTCIHTTPWGMITHLFLLQDLFLSTNSQINYPLWSVSIEWRIYFLFPILALLWRQLGAGKTTLLTIGLSSLLYWRFHGTQYAGSAPHYIGLFALGMLSATIAYGRDPAWSVWSQRVPWAAVSAAAFLVVFVAPALFHRNILGAWLPDILLGVFAATLLLAASVEGPNLLRSILSWKPLVVLGTFSYSLYLMHAPLLQVIWQLWLQPLQLSPWLGFLGFVCVGLPVLIGVCYLFYLAFERPFLNTKPPVSREPSVLSLPSGPTQEARPEAVK